jgi:hypothetical protein
LKHIQNRTLDDSVAYRSDHDRSWLLSRTLLENAMLLIENKVFDSQLPLDTSNMPVGIPLEVRDIFSGSSKRRCQPVAPDRPPCRRENSDLSNFCVQASCTQ